MCNSRQDRFQSAEYIYTHQPTLSAHDREFLLRKMSQLAASHLAAVPRKPVHGVNILEVLPIPGDVKQELKHRFLQSLPTRQKAG